MTGVLEFFVPAHARDLEDLEKTGPNQYHISEPCEFDIHPRQQLDDLTRLFDCLHREKSPTSLFSKPELFTALFSYIKAIECPETNQPVTKQARHKICHEISERLKKLLQICLTYFRRKAGGINDALLVCLRSTVKMYVFILCNILLSPAPLLEDDENVSYSSQRSARKRKRAKSEHDVGIGEDSSGVDQDGRELALTALIDVCSPDLFTLWGDNIEKAMLSLMLRMVLHMITQKANVQNDAQPVSGALAVLLLRIFSHITAYESFEPSDFILPMVELSLKTESAAQFLTRFVLEAESGDNSTDSTNKVVTTLVEGVAAAALHDVSGDAAAAKNMALFFSEVAKRCVSVTARMADVVIQTIHSESYEIRKSVITCITEMIIQRYTGPTRSVENEEETKDKYLSEILFRIMDCNPFVRNHTIHMWERLVEARSIPKRFHLAVTNAIVGRLEDRNYLVRDAALQVIACILRKNWFGHVLSSCLVRDKLEESKTASIKAFDDEYTYNKGLEELRITCRPVEIQSGDFLRETEENTTNHHISLSEVQSSLLNRVIFYEKTLEFAELIKNALAHATALLDSNTERDVIEAIKLIVACNEYRIEGSDKAFLRVLVMIFEGEIKIQCAVRDAFVEVVFTAFARTSTSSLMRNTASAHKLIAFLRDATEGDVAAVDRIFGLMKCNPSFSRLISGQFMDAVWGIAEGPLDHEVSIIDKRTAMRLFSLLCKHDWRELCGRKENIVEFLRSGLIKDNVLLAYCLKSLECEYLNPQYQPIPARTIPSEHVILEQLVIHLCRRTSALSSWLILADAAVNAIHSLCESPALIYTYILDYIVRRIETDSNSRTQLFFLLGRTALKQLVAVDCTERQQLRRLDADVTSQKPLSDLSSNINADVMHKELGLGSHEYMRHAIQELAQRRKTAIMSEGSVWYRYSKYIVTACQEKSERFVDRVLERVCAVMALSELMVISDVFCEEHLDLLFAIVSDRRESWVVKTNTVIALGDLACAHPNLLAPYLKVPTTGFFKLLNDDDLRVRAVTIQVCSHLVLGEMLRIRDHLYAIVKLVADPDETIANNAMTFVQNLAMKEKEKTGNLIPPLVAQLSHSIPPERFQLAMRSLLERVEGDKPTESLIERLCQRFEPYSERGKKKRQMARNLAFCLNEITYSTEKSIKKITSESCYQQYKQWLRDEIVLDHFKSIATKAKRVGQRAGNERRDKAAIEEWEARMQADSRSLEAAEGETGSVGSDGGDHEGD